MIKCEGCGAALQNCDVSKEGYVKDLSKSFCERCFKIRNYNEYKFVDKSNDYYLNIIKQIERTNDLVLLVTDFLNTESLNEINIDNPIILVLAKRDLIPRSLDESKLLSKVSEGLKVVDKVIIGAFNNYNLDVLREKISRHQKSKNVYIIGYTSSGKSTLINKFVENYSDSKIQITTSILPSTTLDLIEVEIDEGLTLIDTPGLLDEGSAILTSEGKLLNKILPKKEIKPIVIQVKVDQSIIVENILRLDVKKGTNLIFYMSNSLKIERYYKPVDKLSDLRSYDINVNGGFDIVVKGLGFIKATKKCKGTLYVDENVKYAIRQSII